MAPGGSSLWFFLHVPEVIAPKFVCPWGSQSCSWAIREYSHRSAYLRRLEYCPKGLRHWHLPDIQFCVEGLWWLISWWPWDHNSWVCQILWLYRFFRFIFAVWSFFILLTRSGGVRSLIPHILEGRTHRWSSRRWVDLVRLFPIYVDINVKWFPVFISWHEWVPEHREMNKDINLWCDS